MQKEPYRGFQAMWEIFEALADWHVHCLMMPMDDEDEQHVNPWMGVCPKCVPVLAALRSLGWQCDPRLAEELDAINECASQIEAALADEAANPSEATPRAAL